MTELGAERLLEMRISAEPDEWETSFVMWLPELWLTLKAPKPQQDMATRVSDAAHFSVLLCC